MSDELKEIAAPQATIKPCDIRYLTIGYVRLRDGTEFWTADHHKTREQAEREAEYCSPGTLRIFEIPEQKGKNGNTES